MNFERIVDVARAMYDPATHPTRTFHFSAVVCKGRMVAIGINSPKTHTINLRNPKFSKDGTVNVKENGGSCSELKACIRLKNQTGLKYSKCTLVNVRIDKKGRITNSKPCQSCASLLKYFNFDKVYHTNDNGGFERY